MCTIPDSQAEPKVDDAQQLRRMHRRRFLGTSVCGALGAMGLGGYGFGIEPRWLRVERPTIGLPGLPEAFDGFAIAQLSDFHRSQVVAVRHVEHAVGVALGLKPDLIVLSGDYITGDATFVHSIAPAIRRLTSAVRTYAVLGNHDHWAGPVTIETCLVECGVRMLTNAAERIERDGSHIWLLGTDDYMVGADDLPAAMDEATSPGVRILLTHNPDPIHEVASAGIDLMICGHTHGGQVSLPWIGPLIVPSQHGAKFAAGLYQVEQTQLYVNRGIGVIPPPARFRVRPEVTLFTLRGTARA